MENITFYEQINPFLENKDQGNPWLAYIGLTYTYISTDLHTQLGF